MPSAFAHAAPALALVPAFAGPNVPKRLWVAGMLCAAAPDLDVLGFSFGVQYGDLLGHRGLSHSIPFAAVVTAPIRLLVARRGWAAVHAARARVFVVASDEARRIDEFSVLNDDPT